MLPTERGLKRAVNPVRLQVLGAVCVLTLPRSSAGGEWRGPRFHQRAFRHCGPASWGVGVCLCLTLHIPLDAISRCSLMPFPMISLGLPEVQQGHTSMLHIQWQKGP